MAGGGSGNVSVQPNMSSSGPMPGMPQGISSMAGQTNAGMVNMSQNQHIAASMGGGPPTGSIPTPNSSVGGGVGNNGGNLNSNNGSSGSGPSGANSGGGGPPGGGVGGPGGGNNSGGSMPGQSMPNQMGMGPNIGSHMGQGPHILGMNSQAMGNGVTGMGGGGINQPVGMGGMNPMGMNPMASSNMNASGMGSGNMMAGAMGPGGPMSMRHHEQAKYLQQQQMMRAQAMQQHMVGSRPPPPEYKASQAQIMQAQMMHQAGGRFPNAAAAASMRRMAQQPIPPSGNFLFFYFTEKMRVIAVNYLLYRSNDEATASNVHAASWPCCTATIGWTIWFFGGRATTTECASGSRGNANGFTTRMATYFNVTAAKHEF